ncbi:hypothetical protein ACGFYV_37230 [Streptomyces sp. NPDC048297]
MTDDAERGVEFLQLASAGDIEEAYRLTAEQFISSRSVTATGRMLCGG